MSISIRFTPFVPFLFNEWRNTTHQPFEQDQFLIRMVDHRGGIDPFFSRVDETGLVMMQGGDGFSDFGYILNLQMGSPITGAHVSFLGIRLQVDSSSPDTYNGCNGSQSTLF
ncbi:MAG: hypothetical protein MK230_08535, partial [Candidatus Marinimicrobia bacterium]|nr:hypothetical protein [Candidatus Neomarinimicrobiota bacterium]